ncbi:glucan endo-1,3-beta-glucosidase 1 [Cicer arietinum]|uniref:glucan endo-1,3-beta-D-glucosidase n=1 Tax=Cicer arietinum TaxID=3827 RepID=A0A1S2YNX5_CICAR|nr:glucan endo-1,3-beta-glucosidase 1 [Cicer arietinum]
MATNSNNLIFLLSILSFSFLSISTTGNQTTSLPSTYSHFQIKQQNEENGPFVGVNIGSDVENMPSGSDLASFLQLQKITHVRIYDANPDILKSLSGTKIRVIISVPNNQLIAIGSSNTTAASWIYRNVVSFYPQTLITGISVGDEVLTTVPSSVPLLLPAMQSLYNALVASNLHQKIKVSTPHASSIILDPFPPSEAFFNQTLVSFILPILQFLSKTESPLMMNFYPYYVFMQNKGVVPLDNALFKSVTPDKEMVDPNTLLHYTNVFDAMIDAAYFSMKNLNVTDVVVLVTETGWPSKGDSKEPYASKDNADTYNSNLIKHVFDHSGTPLHPEVTSSVYVYELFDEDLRSSPVSEANWGLFYGNMTAVYLLHVSGIGTFLANDTTNQTYCVAMDGFDSKTLQAALDWACGPGRANCSEIQPGESCYKPSNVKNHASYAFDSYYQKEGKAPGTCDFKGVAMITTTDPSHGSCVYPGSKKISNKTKEVVNSTQSNSAGERLRFRIMISCIKINTILRIFLIAFLPSLLSVVLL